MFGEVRSIFVYEYATGGGLDVETEQVELRRALEPEGAAMRRALAADLEAAGYTVVTLPTALTLSAAQPSAARLQDRAAAFEQCIERSDGVLLIAPELDRLLERLVERAAARSARLLSPDQNFIAIASDKQAAAERLRAAGVPVPEGWRVEPHVGRVRPVAGPLVRKLIDGAGSLGVEWVLGDAIPARPCATRVELFCPGLPASVALLCGTTPPLALPACQQHIATDGSFTYLGGSLPLPAALNHRAQQLALSALQALPNTQGYVGVDLVLGEARDGSGDFVLEINPRLTTSYIGLRQAARQNLAAVMVQRACGHAAALEFSSTPVHFSPSS